MRLKSYVAAFAALSLAAAPAVAQSRAAAPAAQAQIEPVAERVEGSEINGGFILPTLAIVAIIVAILLLTRDEDPVSA